MKKKKSFKKVVSLALATILTAVPVLSTAMVTKAANPVILAPENMVQFDIVDEDGNALDGVAYTITNSAGVDVAAFDSDGSFRELNDSNIEGDDEFHILQEKLEPLVAPDKIYDGSSTGMGYEATNGEGYTYYVSSNYVPLSSGQERNIYIRTWTEEDIALTVPANTVVVNADAQWANGVRDYTVTADGLEYSVNNTAGTLMSIPVPSDGKISIGSIGSTDYTMPTEPTEYIKMRMKVSDLDSTFNDKGMAVISVVGDEEIAVASGQSNPGEAMIRIISGSVINMPVPDADGYIEFYVENTERIIEFRSDFYGYNFGGGGRSYSTVATVKVYMTVRAVDFPTDVNYMTFVPADTYTINVTSVPDGYEVPAPITFTVQNSQQFQTAKIEVAKTVVHQHSFTNEYSSDADNHWNTCACGATGNVAAHVPGPAATEQSAQTCTVCGYEIAPMLQHTHSYGTAYSSDADNHWNECACGADGNVAVHSFEWITDKPATTSEAGSKHEECSVCGYEKTPVEIPKLTTDDDSNNDTNNNTNNNNTNNNTSNNTNTNTNNAGSAPVQNPVTEEVKDDVPKTGDSPVIPLAVAGCVVALGGIAVLIYFKKKENA